MNYYKVRDWKTDCVFLIREENSLKYDSSAYSIYKSFDKNDEDLICNGFVHMIDSDFVHIVTKNGRELKCDKLDICSDILSELKKNTKVNFLILREVHEDMAIQLKLSHRY
jgi:hypothetical protein